MKIMKFLTRILCYSLLVFSVNINAYSSTISPIQQNSINNNNSINNIQVNNPVNITENLYKEKITEFLNKSPEERKQFIKDYRNNIIRKSRKYNDIIFHYYNKILQLDYDTDTQILRELFNNNRIKTILTLDRASFNILSKSINNTANKDTTESVFFDNKIEFADLLFQLRTKLNNLYKSINHTNIQNIYEQYRDTINTLHEIIKKNGIYNNYSIKKHSNMNMLFYNNNATFDAASGTENDKDKYYKIEGKLSFIQNARCALQNCMSKDPYNKYNANTTHVTYVSELQDDIYSYYVQLRDVIMQCHYLVIKSINEILYLYFKDAPIRSNSKVKINYEELYKKYIEFFTPMNLRTTHNSSTVKERFVTTRNFVGYQYDSIQNFFCHESYKLNQSAAVISNSYLNDIVSVCYLYDKNSYIKKHIQLLKDCSKPGNYSLIQTSNEYGPKLMNILQNMSKELSKVS